MARIRLTPLSRTLQKIVRKPKMKKRRIKYGIEYNWTKESVQVWKQNLG